MLSSPGAVPGQHGPRLHQPAPIPVYSLAEPLISTPGQQFALALLQAEVLTLALIFHWHLPLLLTGPCVVCGYCQQYHPCYTDILNSKHPCTELHSKCTQQGIAWLRAYPENLNSPPKSWNFTWIVFKVVHITNRLLISMTLFRRLSSKTLATFYVKLTSTTFRAQHGN